jgi:tryptophan synthase alpha chain
MPTRIEPLFRALKSQQRAALIAYVTAGDPTPERTPGIVAALERGGVDLIELGVPFSDPIADGPVIQAGAERALKAGTTLHKVLGIARTIRETSQIPLLLFTYLNPAMRYGFEKLGVDAKAAGIDGCLLTDLSVEEAEPYVKAIRAIGLDTVFLAAPTTGEQAALSDSLKPLVQAMRGVTTLPLAAGFGISTPEQAGAVSKIADGVVVGSAFVRLIANHALDGEIESFARSLREGMDR